MGLLKCMSASHGSPQAQERLQGPATEGGQPGAWAQTRATTWGEAAATGPGFTGPTWRKGSSTRVCVCVCEVIIKTRSELITPADRPKQLDHTNRSDHQSSDLSPYLPASVSVTALVLKHHISSSLQLKKHQCK